jgi:hypothetical protein
LIGSNDPEMMKVQAILEYENNVDQEEKDRHVSYAGYVQCFCDANALKEGFKSDATYGKRNVPVC